MKKMLTNDDSFVPHVGQLLDETTLHTRSCTRGGKGQHLGAASIVHALSPTGQKEEAHALAPGAQLSPRLGRLKFGRALFPLLLWDPTLA